MAERKSDLKETYDDRGQNNHGFFSKLINQEQYWCDFQELEPVFPVVVRPPRSGNFQIGIVALLTCCLGGAVITHVWQQFLCKDGEFFFPTYITVTFLLVLVQFNPVLSIQVARQQLVRIGWYVFTMYIHDIILFELVVARFHWWETWSWDWGCCSPAVEPGARGQPGWFKQENTFLKIRGMQNKGEGPPLQLQQDSPCQKSPILECGLLMF